MRSLLMCAVVFVAETVPRFGVLLNLVGASVATLLTMIFPGILNLYLIAARTKKQALVGRKASTADDDERATLAELRYYFLSEKF